ncbi:aldo/keto reductase [Fructilactobacillus vespulae]|uniref:aldo/keto reductase n=1 Tax=Fructilactobacillus vespulae TaxID=1249630 RepID=UPI0039B5E0FD
MQHNQTVTLNNGIEMPMVGFGVWQNSNPDTAAVVQKALKAGYRSIDTAKKYGNEPGVGVGLKAGLAENNLSRADVFLTTKVFIGDAGYESTLAAFDKQLEDLQTEYVDLLLIHWPVPGKYIETWKALEEIYKAGKARAIGVSNFDIEKLTNLFKHSSIKPAVNQMEFNPLQQETDIKNFCDANGIQLEAWGPLGHGSSLKHPVIEELAAKYHRSAAQIIIRWELQRGVVTIPKSNHQEYIESNFQVFDFQITPEDVEKINHLNRDQRSGWYGDWQIFGNPDGRPTAVENHD